REDVVEVVRDAAGQLPNGLHLLRLPRRLFEPVARRHVVEHAVAEQLAGRLAPPARAVVQPDPLARLRAPAVLAVEDVELAAHEALALDGDARQVFGVRAQRPERGALV